MNFIYINPIAVKIGPLQIHWYAICIVLAIICALYLTLREARKVGIAEDNVYDFLILGLPIAFIGARIYYVIFEWSYYQEHLSQIWAIWNGGIAIYGGLIAGALFLWYFCRKRQINIIKYLDILAPAVLLAQAIGRWGNFFNHEAYGPVVSRHFLESLHLPQFIIANMQVNGLYHAPTFLYESMWSLIGVILLLSYRKFKKVLYVGEMTSLYLMWYSFGRFFIEGLRMDSLYLFGFLRISQLVSVILFGLGIYVMYCAHRKKNKEYI